MQLVTKKNAVLNGIWQKFYIIGRHYPNLYAAIVLLAASMGFGILLLFPALFVAGGWYLLNTPDTITDSPLLTLAWVAITVLSGFVTLRLSGLKFQQAEGIALNPSMALNLYRLLDKVGRECAIPRIKHIVISEQVSIDVVKMPRYPIPLWSDNTLVIGLPLMQCLSPEYFECALVRKLLQHSKQRHAIIKWLHQLRQTWLMYQHQFNANRNFSNLIMSILFRLYVPLYRELSVPVANRVELLSDQDSLDILNDEDLLQTIEKVIVTKIYLDRQYWPKIDKMLTDSSYQYMDPYTRLEDALKIGLTNQNAKRWLDTLYNEESTQLKAIPGLRARMHNIGRTRIRIPERVRESAATHYLHDDYFKVVSGVNRLWSQRLKSHHVGPNHTFTSHSPAAQHNPANLPTSLSMDIFH